MIDGFYLAFEEKHRGSRALITTRLRVYLPFVSPLADAYAEAPIFDAGCGRGEWLELMTELGFNPYGVDLDDGMLSNCFELNLPAEKGDAMVFLAKLPSESQAVVSAFHVVEHVTFTKLQTFISEALRVLKPGGLLIMETPNPENIFVGTTNFYLDPTHQRPIPPQLLSFLPEYYGFERQKVLRLQEFKELSNSETLTLLNVLTGVSPDYAVVAQKAGPREIMAATDLAFEDEYGISLEYLADKYNRQTEAKIVQAEAKIVQAEAKAAQAAAKADQAEAKAVQAAAKADQAEAKAVQAEVRVTESANELMSIYTSYSWRLTYPLRLANAVVRRNVVHPIINRALRPFAHWLLKNEKIATPTRRILRKSNFARRVSRQIIYGLSPASEATVSGVNGKQKLFDFSSGDTKGPLSIEELMTRIRSEITSSNRDKTL